MSCGGVFKLVANDGKADRMILATLLLNQRIKDIMIARRLAGKADFTPTLPDLERTHILYMNAHFKPYAAIGFEYNKIKPQSGTPTLGTQMTFSIPQFGDFFYDMVCHIVIPSVSGSPVNFPTIAPALWDPSADFNSDPPPNPNNPFLPSGAPTVLTGSFVVKNMTSKYGGILFPVEVTVHLNKITLQIQFQLIMAVPKREFVYVVFFNMHLLIALVMNFQQVMLVFQV